MGFSPFILVLERTAKSTFRVAVVNSGQGSQEYHFSSPTSAPPKIQTRLTMVFQNVKVCIVFVGVVVFVIVLYFVSFFSPLRFASPILFYYHSNTHCAERKRSIGWLVADVLEIRLH